MRIFTNETSGETVKSFLLRKCQEITLHSLAVYHPDSKGNVFHGRVVLEVLLNHWPKSFMAALSNQRHIQRKFSSSLSKKTKKNSLFDSNDNNTNNNTHNNKSHNTQQNNNNNNNNNHSNETHENETEIENAKNVYNNKCTVLLKNALLRSLHLGNLNGFFLELICFRPTAKAAQIQPVKRKLLQTFMDWKFLDYIIDVASGYKHEDDIAVKYGTFFIDLIARSAAIPEAAEMFHGYEIRIVDSFLEGLIDKENKRSLFHRILCGQILIQFLDIASRPTIINPAAAYADMLGLVPPEPSPNVLHLMFERSLKHLHKWIDRLCNEITKERLLEPIALASGIIDKPLGHVRLDAIELLTVSIDFAQFQCAKVLKKVPNQFWCSLLDMAFTHPANNMFLCHFRRLVHLTMIFRRRILKMLFEECKLLERFIEFFQNNETRSALHGYILQMLWDIYNHDDRNENTDEEEEDEDGADANSENDENNEEEEDEDAKSTSSIFVNEEEKDKDKENAENKDKDNKDKKEDNKDNKNKDKKDDNKKENKDVNKKDDKNNKTDKNNKDKTEKENQKEKEEENKENNDNDSDTGNFADADPEMVSKPNYSREAEDQWDIIKFFDSNEQWKLFQPILKLICLIF